MPSTALGDWHADLLSIRRRRLVICVNDRSYLVVLLPGRDLIHLAPKFRDAAASLLVRVGAPPELVAAERREMDTIWIGHTTSRSVLGVMNECIYECRWFVERHGDFDLEQTVIRLSASPWSPLKGGFPVDRALELLKA